MLPRVAYQHGTPSTARFRSCLTLLLQLDTPARRYLQALPRQFSACGAGVPLALPKMYAITRSASLMPNSFAVNVLFPESAGTRTNRFPKREIGSRVIRPGFLDSESRQDLIELTRDGSAAHRLARQANALLLLDDGMSCGGEDINGSRRHHHCRMPGSMVTCPPATRPASSSRPSWRATREREIMPERHRCRRHTFHVYSSSKARFPEDI